MASYNILMIYLMLYAISITLEGHSAKLKERCMFCQLYIAVISVHNLLTADSTSFGAHWIFCQCLRETQEKTLYWSFGLLHTHKKPEYENLLSKLTQAHITQAGSTVGSARCRGN